MKDHERQALIDRIDRESATVGASIPERLTVQGDELPLREEVLAFQRMDLLTPTDEEHLRTLTVALRRERVERIDRLETATIDRGTGEEIVDAVIGIDRALAALATVGDEIDLETEIQRQEVEDMKRWRAFLERAKGGIDRGIDR